MDSRGPSKFCTDALTKQKKLGIYFNDLRGKSTQNGFYAKLKLQL